MYSKRKYLRERKCPICGKNFIPAPQHSWGYRKNKNQFVKVCSYSCHREAQRQKESKRKRPYRTVI